MKAAIPNRSGGEPRYNRGSGSPVTAPPEHLGTTEPDREFLDERPILMLIEAPVSPRKRTSSEIAARFSAARFAQEELDCPSTSPQFSSLARFLYRSP